MIKREVIPHLRKLLKQFPAVALLGPRQVGKTTLARQMGKWKGGKVIHLDLEKASDRQKIGDPELFFESHRDKLVILDEIQTVPELFIALRPEIDAKRKPGRFLLTGSASPELVKYVSESLAGRITYIELTPFTLTEARSKGYSMKRHWYRGGFPGALLARTDDAFDNWADAYIRSYAQRDLSALFGFNLSPEVSGNLLSMLAHVQGNVFNAEGLSRGLGVTGPTISRYVDFLQGAFLLRKLPAWYVNAKKRMVKAPKLYIRDSGLLHNLAHVDHPDDLSGHPVVGGSWEGYCIEEICRQLPAKIHPHFYRTHHGAEIDLLLVRGIKPIAAIEIKHSSTPVISAGTYEAADELKLSQIHVVVPAGDKYRLSGKATVYNLENFMRDVLPGLIK